MIRALANIFSAPPFQHEAHALYITLVEQARKPEFYTDHLVADTVDGRFDMIALHLFLVIDRLKKEETEESLELIRALMELFFSDMDRSLREMGSTDTGVGKRIKNMSQAFYGRLFAYQTAGDEPQKIEEALLRNLYRGDEHKYDHAMGMAQYVLKQRENLAAQEADALMSGRVIF